MPSWIGPWEIAIVVVIALLIFGPRKLPELGSSFGKSIRGFKAGLKEGQDELNKTVAEVKEAATGEPSVAQTTTAEAVSSTASAEARSAEAGSAEATTATATMEAEPVADSKPRCWGTYEKDDASCLQCTVSADCAKAGAEAPSAG
jgi:sec-independent protein translocase protein TatA